MTRGQDKVIMDAVSTTFGKQNKIVVSKGFALFLLILFVGCLVATGLLAYSLSSCTITPDYAPKHTEECNQTKKEPIAAVVFEENNLIESTSTIVPSSTTINSPTTSKKVDVRLPRSVLPEVYDIQLIPFIIEGNFTFHGEVTIIVNVTEPTDNITLHSDELVIEESFIRVTSWSGNSSDETISILQVVTDAERQFLIIHLAEILNPPEQYSVYIKFHGILNDLLQGFYRSSYKVDDQVRWIAATQFQPTDARKAFPCFDEPAMKAKFKISLARLENMTTLSNMPRVSVESIEDHPGYVWDHYEESLPMSTYLVAFVVSDFISSSNNKFSVWTRKEAIAQANYSLEIGPKILRFYENFFNMSFPLPKMDMIALPDFSAGAMENWGLITYRESAMLYDEVVSTRMSKQRIASVIAHELAHQWFGNLVTPKWWTDLWLNEGFATYMEYIGTDAVQPTWRVLDQFVVNELQNVLALDALKSSHQISVTVNNPSEINEIFDRISYAKGATILRMMEHFLTSEVFKRGLSSYLTSRMYGNADQDDLWQALTDQAYKDGIFDSSTSIKEIMDTWTLKTGFPVVFVNRSYQDGSVTFAQQRCTLVHSDSDVNNTDSSLWWIPITYTGKNSESVSTVWMKAEKEIKVDQLNVPEADWLLVNYEQRGYYRVNYDVTNWKMLTEQLRDEKGYLAFSPTNRAQMLDDSMNLAAAGYIDYDIPLNITRYLHIERDFIPWKAAFTSLDYIQEMFLRTSEFDKFKKYMLSLINGVYIKVGFRESYKDSQITVYNRLDVLWRACFLGHNDCVMNAVTMFQNWRNSADPDRYNPISPNLKNVVYCTAIRAGGQEEWDFAWKRYLNTNVGSERDLILSALGCTREIWLLARYLHWAVTDGYGIRKQDSTRVFAAVSNNVVGQELVYKFLKNNWDKIREYMGSSLMLLSSIVRTSTSKFNTQEEVEDLKEFYKNRKDVQAASRAFQQSIEQGEANVRWMRKNFDYITKWLSTFKTAI